MIEQFRSRLKRANPVLLATGIGLLFVAWIPGLTISGVSLGRELPWWGHLLLFGAGLLLVTLSLVVGVQIPEELSQPTGGFLGAAPIQTSHLVARPAYMRRLIHELQGRETRPVALAGMAGVGKTVLATEAARAPEIRQRFSGGVIWLEVDRQPDVVALQGRVARLLGEPNPAFREVA